MHQPDMIAFVEPQITLKELELLIEILDSHQQRLRSRLHYLVQKSYIFHHEDRLRESLILLQKLRICRRCLGAIEGRSVCGESS